MTTYMATLYWQGLNVGHMRAFDNEPDARAYITAALHREYPHISANGHTLNMYSSRVRLYKLTDTNPPEKLRFP